MTKLITTRFKMQILGTPGVCRISRHVVHSSGSWH